VSFCRVLFAGGEGPDDRGLVSGRRIGEAAFWEAKERSDDKTAGARLLSADPVRSREERLDEVLATPVEASRTWASAGALRAGRLDGRDGMEAPREFSDERGAVGPEFAESPKNSLRPVAAEGGIRGMREI
jgi:hypothetical protein